MPRTSLPLKNPKPNVSRFLDIIRGKIKPQRPPLIDLKVDRAVMKPIVIELLNRRWVNLEMLSFPALFNARPQPPLDRADEIAAWDNFVEFWYRLGYDAIRFEVGMIFPRIAQTAADDTMTNRERRWADLGEGVIVDWESFEEYPWPKLEDVNFFPLEYVSSHLPEGMGLFISHAAGVFEHVSELVSFEKLCYLLYDDFEFVRAVCDRIGELMESFYRQVIDFPHICAIFPGDDMGFRTSTLISPQALRELFLPWHARFAKIAHDSDLSFYFHSCGDVYNLMPDLINTVNIDAKHSFEDAILPVEEFLRQYGDRVGALGGLDVGYLSQHTPEEVKVYVREKIERCTPYSKFAVGTGSSVTSYIPPQNYLAMLEAVLGTADSP
ncbi:MAG: uroporphyrinogen decarboxylase family protein [Anaerolineales bacterium]